MDSAGWHARHRARREEDRWSQPQRGPDGQYQPVEQLYGQPFVGGFAAGSPQYNRPMGTATPPPPLPPRDPPLYSPLSPPPVPPKNNVNGSSIGRAWSQTSHAEAMANEGATHPSHFLATLSAVERSQNLKLTRMNPYVQLVAGPLLRYDTVDSNGIWHGAALIVSADANSTYEPHPTLSYSWDPSISSSSRTSSRSGPSASFDLGSHPSDPHANVFSTNDDDSLGPNAIKERSSGQEIWVYCGNGGSYTFWRFMMHIPLSHNEMKISYTVNNGPNLHFFVPARNQNMHWAAFSCNGFSAGVNPDDFRGPGFASGYDPVWTDLLAHHARLPIHVLVGGGDQIYCDAIVREPEMQEWFQTQRPERKKAFPLTQEMRLAIDRFYFNHYCQIFRSGAFARANSSIESAKKIDGFGSYPDDLMRSSVFGTIGSRGYFFFLLFQCFVNPEVDGIDDRHHPFQSTIIGGPGPYVPFPSHSMLSYLGPKVYILALDCRAERTKDQVCSQREYNTVFARVNTLPRGVEHFVLLTGIPIAYPRMVFLENALDSKLNPLVALGRNGSLGLSGFVNKFNADAELLDDLNDHWTATAHKRERNWLIEQLQRFAKTKHIRVSLLGGDVHCCAVGVLKTLVRGKKQQDIPPALDYRYMLNIVSSKLLPPNGVLTMVSTLATKTHRTMHHVDTDESMLPIFTQDPDGTQAKSKYIMGRRNWCDVQWEPGSGALRFDIRVEREKGYGETVGYAVAAPAPRWEIS
ncbi:hypothetical protein C8Q75DRAFT_751734 [Abortiporus biennis]|nr:hypothetical protein C8Q75DRAFT_751734 [Abortiporus biennis]